MLGRRRPFAKAGTEEQCGVIPGEMLGKEAKMERDAICRAVVSTVHALTHLIHTQTYKMGAITLTL